MRLESCNVSESTIKTCLFNKKPIIKIKTIKKQDSAFVTANIKVNRFESIQLFKWLINKKERTKLTCKISLIVGWRVCICLTRHTNRKQKNTTSKLICLKLMYFFFIMYRIQIKMYVKNLNRQSNIKIKYAR